LRAGLPLADGVEQVLVHGPGSLAGAAALVDGGDWPLALDVREDAIVYTLDAATCGAAHVEQPADVSPARHARPAAGARPAADLARPLARRESQRADEREAA
jgi:hypothetical protein